MSCTGTLNQASRSLEEPGTEPSTFRFPDGRPLRPQTMSRPMSMFVVVVTECRTLLTSLRPSLASFLTSASQESGSTGFEAYCFIMEEETTFHGLAIRKTSRLEFG